MITSKQNAIVKKIRSLQDKKFRDKLNLYIIEGLKMTKEGAQNNAYLECVLCTERMAEKVQQFYPNFETVSDEVMDYMSSEVTPQGVIAIAKKPNFEITAPSGYCLLLDGVGDPANVGAIIRTAAASGFNQVYLASCADAYSPKAVRASMSGIFKVQTIIANMDDILKAIDIPIVVADMSGIDARDYKPTSPVCLVIGSEAHGVSEKLKNRADVTVRLSMDNDMESLNASVSASILMYSIKGKI